jgi:thiol-disulfide isomerase/thioredoxin
MSLYNNNDPVHILNDSKFIGPDMRIKTQTLAGPGVLKVYATWCPHCQSKVEGLNKLAGLLEPHGMSIYVLDGENNPIFCSRYKVQGFPTFFEVSEGGSIGKQLQIGRVEDVVTQLCGKNKAVCAFIDRMQKTTKPGK